MAFDRQPVEKSQTSLLNEKNRRERVVERLWKAADLRAGFAGLRRRQTGGTYPQGTALIERFPGGYPQGYPQMR